MISVWEEGIEEHIPVNLRKDQSCQVLILGASLTGLFTALLCEEQGWETIVIEEDTLEVRALEVEFFTKITEEEAQHMSMWYEQIIRRHRLKCHFKTVPYYRYDPVKKEKQKIAQYPIFHPLKLFLEIQKRISVFEQTEIEKIKEHRIVTTQTYVDFQILIDARNRRKPLIHWCAFEESHLPEGFYEDVYHKDQAFIWKQKICMKNPKDPGVGWIQPENKWKTKEAETIFCNMEQVEQNLKQLGKDLPKCKNHTKI